MARRRSSRLPRQAGRKFVWARYHVDQIIPAEDTSFIDLLADFFVDYGANMIGSTVMRLRGELEFEPASAVDNVVCAAGVIVMSRNVASDITAGSQSGGPLDDKHADWMAYKPLIFSSGTSPAVQNQRWELDVKSARKMEEVGDGLFLAVENDVVGVTITVRGIVSVGLKLP